MALGQRGRRWLRLLLVAGVLLAIGAWWIDRQLEPQRLTATVLKKAGEALKLDLRYTGDADYALKPEPRLLIPNLEVRDPRDQSLILSARRAEVSLPWDTLTGGEPVITRIELDAPVLDLPALLRWQASRPKTPFKLPTLTRGIEVVDGTIRDTAFMLTKLALDLPQLQAGEPAEAGISMRLASGDLQLDFRGKLTAATPGLQSAFTLDGSGALLQKPQPLPFKIAMRGDFRSDDTTTIAITAPTFQLTGTSPLPVIDGKASFVLADAMTLAFEGELAQWPADWPALPQPLSEDTGALAVKLDYRGAADFGDPLSLKVDRDQTHVAASLRLAEMQAWVAQTAGSPLPPLNATITTPTLTFDGITLEGVQIEIRDSETGTASKPAVESASSSPAKR